MLECQIEILAFQAHQTAGLVACVGWQWEGISSDVDCTFCFVFDSCSWRHLPQEDALVVRGWLFCLSAFYRAARVCSQGSLFNSRIAGHLHLHSQGISEELRPILLCPVDGGAVLGQQSHPGRGLAPGVGGRRRQVQNWPVMFVGVKPKTLQCDWNSASLQKQSVWEV